MLKTTQITLSLEIFTKCPLSRLLGIVVFACLVIAKFETVAIKVTLLLVEKSMYLPEPTLVILPAVSLSPKLLPKSNSAPRTNVWVATVYSNAFPYRLEPVDLTTARRPVTKEAL